MSTISGIFTRTGTTFKGYAASLGRLSTKIQNMQEVQAAVTEWASGELTDTLKSRAPSKSGNLRDAVYAQAKTSGRGASKVAFIEVKAPRIPYALISDQGGVILPKKAQALTIPFPNSPAWEKQQRGEKVRAKDFGPLIKRRGHPEDNVWYKRMGAGKGSYLVPMFILEDSVTIKGTKWIQKSMDQARPQLISRMQAALIGSLFQ